MGAAKAILRMTAQELKETGQKLCKSGQFAEAIPLLKSAADALPDDEHLWEELVVAARDSGQDGQAIEFAKLGIRHHPRSYWLWQELGSRLVKVDKLDEAEKALDNARSLNPGSPWLWRYLIRLHQKRENYAKEIEAWEKLRDLGEMDGADLNSLGIAYYNHENFAKAVEFYQQSATKLPDTSAFFNLGLVFNHPEVSQDADAADAYRCALMLNPNYEAAKERIEATKKKLLPLAESARIEAGGLIKPDECFQFYLNPFEVFQVTELHGNENQNKSIEVDADGVARPQLLPRSGSALDIKAIQRAKKRLLQEIELNDGRVPWLENQPIDKSRALALEDEFLGEEKQGFHRAVFNSPRLLRFLTRGDIEHFLYSDEYFPEEILELLDNEPEFRRFISKPFARQYNFLFARAINSHKLAVVEALLDGRRWVEPEDEDICFAGAYKHTKMLIEWVETKVLNAAKTKPDYSEIAEFIEHLAVAETFNLLPTAFFRDDQSRLVEQIRLIAVAAYNKHSDSELSNRILRLCKRFNFKSADLNKQLDEDFKAIEEILTENRKHSFSAWGQQDQAIYVTHTGIKFAGVAISAADDDQIRIIVVEGPAENHFTTNKKVGYLEISGKDLKRDLLRGTEIDLTFEVSESRDLTFHAYVNSSGQEFSQIFNPTYRAVPVKALAKEAELLDGQLEKEKAEAMENENYDVVEKLEKLVAPVQELTGAAMLLSLTPDDETDERYILEDRKRKLAQELSQLTSGKRIERLRNEYRTEKDEVAGIVNESGNDHERRQLHEVVAQEHTFMNSTNSQKIQAAIDQLHRIRGQILRRTPDFLVNWFQFLANMRESLNDQLQAKNLIEAGKRHIAAEDYDKLLEVNERLHSLLPEDEKDSKEMRHFTNIT
ncbi:tetratricopeptide repeat protein [Pontiella sulfatireligans]|uniref:Uncharacterized protein n=1 Tax=Pontiella sulfatireligans TaxID=2750658 RepID=A0A6C2UGH4_9BACT|nr:tetratricopeptide repeat protein [Pontiella sulfatireligans]VGO19019.1 hypothetical protein SCARR_01073 [Pontiella sulfatireligans]